MKALEYSRQREPTKVRLINCHDHPTADVLYANIHREFPNISPGAIYRGLNLPAETGGIRKLICRDSAVHLDGDTRQHRHFMCSECNQACDMELGVIEDLDKEVQEHAPDITGSYYILFYERYSSCLQKEVDKAIDEPA